MKNLLVAQSGGPSSAINATLAGVVEKALLSDKIDKIYGAKYGIKGVLANDLVEIGSLLSSPQELELLCHTPSSALGSCRLKLKNTDTDTSSFDTIISVLRKNNIGYFVYIGGNDSMDTVYKLSKYVAENNIDDIKIMGAPKTIDNDLCEIDHCPGFGSCAKYIATTFTELNCDCKVYDIKTVTIVEIMGRNAGWLTASSALAKLSGCAPDFIYVCERALDTTKFVSDIKNKLEEKNNVIVAVSEGVKGPDGRYISEGPNAHYDSFGHVQLGGTASILKDIVRNEIGCKVRAIELNLMQRSAAHLASATDIYESRMLGCLAADSVIAGESGKMASLDRVSTDPYKVKFSLKDISKIANAEKKIPDEWINEEGNNVTDDIIEYMRPLIQGETPTIFKNGMPVHIKLI